MICGDHAASVRALGGLGPEASVAVVGPVGDERMNGVALAVGQVGVVQLQQVGALVAVVGGDVPGEPDGGDRCSMGLDGVARATEMRSRAETFLSPHPGRRCA